MFHWQMTEMGGGSSRLPFVGHCLRSPQRAGELMKNTKFVVKVNRGGTHATEYVKRIDRTPIQTTTNPKLALVMGRFTAEDAVKSMQNSRCSPELVPVQVNL
jgi:hypothetical protein